MTSKSIDSSFTILYFAAASTYTGKASEQLPAPLPIRSLFPSLEARYPGITAKVLKSCAVTVNLEYVDIGQNDIRSDVPQSQNELEDEAQVIVGKGDEVGIIPPVSSG